MDKEKGPETIKLIGCGILSKEINFLIKKNDWPIQPSFICSSLHVSFRQLEQSLGKRLNKFKKEKKVVFYGTCHPLMEKLIEDDKTIRTPGQNCVDILLGEEKFTEELEAGAFFIMEDWAKRRDLVMTKAFGKNEDVTKSTFQECHQYFLGLRTPCSEDFSQEALEISLKIGLPLKWLDVTLDHLEKNIYNTFKQQES